MSARPLQTQLLAGCGPSRRCLATATRFLGSTTVTTATCSQTRQFESARCTTTHSHGRASAGCSLSYPNTDISTALTWPSGRLSLNGPFTSSNHGPNRIALTHDGAFIAASANPFASFWDIATHRQIGPLIHHPANVISMAITLIMYVHCHPTARFQRDLVHHEPLTATAHSLAHEG